MLDRIFVFRLLGILAICAICIACNRGPAFVVRSPSGATFLENPASVPIIAVGLILSNAKVGGPRKWRPKSNFPSDYEVQLFRLDVKIENTLKGGPISRDVGIYYFAFAGNVGGPPGLGMAGGQVFGTSGTAKCFSFAESLTSSEPSVTSAHGA